MKQFAASLAIVLSLFVSSIPACACSRHLDKAEIQVPSCHQMTMTKDAHEPAADASETVISESGCCCVQPAPRAFAKNENLKIEKQAAKLAPVVNLEIKLTATIVSFKAVQFEPPFYLSDSFYNISPGRAPPRL